MTRLNKVILAAVAVVFALQVSWAQEDAADSRAERSAEMMGRIVERMSGDLKLDDSQKEKFEQVLVAGVEGRSAIAGRANRPRDRSQQQDRDQQRQELVEMLEAENFDVEQFRARSQERQARVDEARANIEQAQEKVLTAFSEFHATLNEAQREKLALLATHGGIPGIGQPGNSRGPQFNRGPNASRGGPDFNRGEGNRRHDGRGSRDQRSRDGRRGSGRDGDNSDDDSAG